MCTRISMRQSTMQPVLVHAYILSLMLNLSLAYGAYLASKPHRLMIATAFTSKFMHNNNRKQKKFACRIPVFVHFNLFLCFIVVRESFASSFLLHSRLNSNKSFALNSLSDSNVQA